jgi:dipeptidase D
MSEQIRGLEPTSVWNHFADLNAVPRPSKKEERVIQFMVDFGKSLGLPTEVDHIGNVFIRKPASTGMEERTPVVLQAHLDMVHQKNNDTDFDFNTQGIDMYVDDDWVKARGTTLGADNGMGVAYIMAVLSSSDIAHPAIDALFTIDEETGMTGALELKGGMLNGKILLNIDTEDDDELTIGCAGGIDINATRKVTMEAAPADSTTYQITVRGLSGGHSGMDIHKGLGNANKLMNRVLDRLGSAVRLAHLDGGGLRNAIPRESVATVVVPNASVSDMNSSLGSIQRELAAEHATTDPNLELLCVPVKNASSVVSSDFQESLITALYANPNGIYRMSPDIEGLVQTSNNTARVLLEDGQLTVLCLTRSSVESEKMDLARAIARNFESIGCAVDCTGSYPGWTPNPKSAILSTMSGLYRELYKEEPRVNACHAGLECGILGTNYPEMELISFGPNIRGAHSPDEKCQISSVQKSWNFFLATLENIPNVD